MGSSVAPRAFPNSTPFGASPQTPITTQTQPLAQNSGTQTPAMSGYTMQTNTPITSPTANSGDGGGGGSPQDLLNQFKANRGNRSMPFYGAMQ